MNKHAVLTDSEGTILGVISYKSTEELRTKTIDTIESIVDEVESTETINTERNFSVLYKSGESEEYYLTLTDVR